VEEAIGFKLSLKQTSALLCFLLKPSFKPSYNLTLLV